MNGNGDGNGWEWEWFSGSGKGMGTRKSLPHTSSTQRIRGFAIMCYINLLLILTLILVIIYYNVLYICGIIHEVNVGAFDRALAWRPVCVRKRCVSPTLSQLSSPPTPSNSDTQHKTCDVDIYAASTVAPSLSITGGVWESGHSPTSCLKTVAERSHIDMRKHVYSLRIIKEQSLLCM